jgi:hypothetical protein
MREALPDVWAGAIGEGRAFDLIRRGGGTPMEIRRKTVTLSHVGKFSCAALRLDVNDYMVRIA